MMMRSAFFYKLYRPISFIGSILSEREIGVVQDAVLNDGMASLRAEI